MIDELQASKFCYFYCKKIPITTTSIAALFRAIRGGKRPPQTTFSLPYDDSVGRQIWSALCFQFDKTPAFLPNSDDVIVR